MARPRLPTNVHELKGSFKKDPARGRAREDEPVAVGELTDPPAEMPPEVAERWREVVGLAHKGVLCEVDALIVEQTAYLLHYLRETKWAVSPAVMVRYEACLGKLGMTPADRSKVSAFKPKGKGGDPLDEFASA